MNLYVVALRLTQIQRKYLYHKWSFRRSRAGNSGTDYEEGAPMG